MTDFTAYKFETRPDLPPDGERGQHLGMDADNNCFVIWWDFTRGGWLGAGRDPQHRQSPIVFNDIWARAHITSHAALPARWSEVA